MRRFPDRSNALIQRATANMPNSRLRLPTACHEDNESYDLRLRKDVPGQVDHTDGQAVRGTSGMNTQSNQSSVAQTFLSVVASATQKPDRQGFAQLSDGDLRSNRSDGQRTIAPREFHRYHDHADQNGNRSCGSPFRAGLNVPRNPRIALSSSGTARILALGASVRPRTCTPTHPRESSFTRGPRSGTPS